MRHIAGVNLEQTMKIITGPSQENFLDELSRHGTVAFHNEFGATLMVTLVEVKVIGDDPNYFFWKGVNQMSGKPVAGTYRCEPGQPVEGFY